MKGASRTAGQRTAGFYPSTSLPFLEHVHSLNATENYARAVKILELLHRPSDTFDGPMVSFDHVVQILDLKNPDGHLAFGIHRMKRGEIGTALVDGRRLGRAVLTDCLFRKPPSSSLVPLGSKQKIDGVARFVHGR